MHLPRERPWPWRCGCCAVLLGLPLAAATAHAADDALPKLPTDITQVEFEDLLNVEVTSVSKRAEPAASAAAAIFVLTGEEIRRSGAQHIAEALRLVPGLEVAQPSAKSYAISARGFLATSADKLEVLVDGRSVYTPLTSAVFWNVLDTYLPDIDRIEVIRGPGAALWGANAVNGVINIVTKPASSTLGASASARGGNAERYGLGARLGTRIGDNGTARLYAQGFDRANAKLASGEDAPDGQQMLQAGFRTDWNLVGGHGLTVSGDLYRSAESGNTINPDGSNGPPAPVDYNGGNVRARWQCCDVDDGRWSVQAAFDTYKIDLPTIFSERRNTAALEFQQQWQVGERQTFVYGFGYKYSHDNTGGPPRVLIFDPDSRALSTYSAFVQDQIAWLDDSLKLTLGSKFEHNSTSGFEIQPSVRLGWQATPSVFTWAAISRAVRTPNRLDQDVAILCPSPNGIPGVCGPGVFRIGNPNLDSEKLLAYEWGLRWRTSPTLSWDLATYYNDYSELRSTETTTPVGAFANRNEAQGYGAELSLIWQPFSHLELRPYYSYLKLDARATAGGTDTQTAPTLEGSNPEHQAGLAVSWSPAPSWYAGGLLRYVDALPRSETPSASSGSTYVPAYVELNLRAAYRITPALELSLAGNNLLHDHHPEFSGVNTRSELPRSVFLELRWNWP